MPIPQTPGEADEQVREPGPRIALVTPYSGGNLGDAAIQDAMIGNLRQRMPGAQFFGITLDDQNFVRQHDGAGAFPFLPDSTPVWAQPAMGSPQAASAAGHARHRVWMKPLRRILRSIPGLRPLWRRARARLSLIRREVSHSYQGYRILRTQDLLVISGGGQLDEEYGGAWRLPFSICKWVILARLARIPCAMASVGAGRITLPASRRFVWVALRLCRYRSFRETRSRAIAASVLSRAAHDPVVPDLAFSLPDRELPSPIGYIRAKARGRPVVALSPMAYAKPGSWPIPKPALYERYVQQLALALSCLSRRGYFLVVVCSSLGDDETVIPDLWGRLDEETRSRLDGQIAFPAVKTWRDLVAVLRDVDCLVASRLHGAILGFVSHVPAAAISPDPKVDWVMEDLGQTDFLLHFQDFVADDVLNAVDRIQARKDAVVKRITSYRQEIFSTSVSARQYDFLAELAVSHHQSRN
jgi:polysaccharide pyruvyl transferase WcaK-like protein